MNRFGCWLLGCVVNVFSYLLARHWGISFWHWLVVVIVSTWAHVITTQGWRAYLAVEKGGK